MTPLTRIEKFLSGLSTGIVPDFPDISLSREEHFLKSAVEAYQYLVEHKLDATFIKDTSPTTTDTGQVGQFWYNTITGEMYVLTDIIAGTPPTYVWDLISSGGTGQGIFVGYVTNGGSFPTTRLDGTALQQEDYVRPNPASTFPFTIGSVEFTNVRDKALYTGSTAPSWVLDPGLVQNTAETPTYDPVTESISETAATQRAVNIENKTEINKKVTKSTIDNKQLVYVRENGTERTVVYGASPDLGSGTIPTRSLNGTIQVGTPTSDNHATTKKYVDELITLEEQATPETGYLKTYVVKKGTTALTPKINIPLDFYVKNGKVTTVTLYAVNTAYSAGDVINNSTGGTFVVRTAITAAANTQFSDLDTATVATAVTTGTKELVLYIAPKSGTADPEYTIIPVDALDTKVDDITIEVSGGKIQVKDGGLKKIKTDPEFWENNTLTGTTNAENITVSGDTTCDDLTADDLTVNTSATVPTPTSDMHAATKKYVDENNDKKVDKSTVDDKKLVYTRTNGTEGTVVYSDTADASTMVLRGENGVINTGVPTAETHAVTKKYVDEKITYDDATGEITFNY